MLPFRKILFPVDYSNSCYAVVPHVRDMVRHFKAELTVMHSYGLGTPDSDLTLADPSWPEKVHRFQDQKLKKFASEHFPAQPLNLRVVNEEPATSIDKYVQHEGTDLVMMPTRGQGPLRRLLLGSVTAKVLHDVSTAVWTASALTLEKEESGHAPDLKTEPVSEEYRPIVPYRSIVCAVDQSDESEAVLRAASALASSYQAELFLVRAVAVLPMALEVDFQIYRKALMDSADCSLQELKSALGIKAHHSITSAPMVDAIFEEARKRKADLLVLGRGESQETFARVWSNLYPLIREAPCPVLSI